MRFPLLLPVPLTAGVAANTIRANKPACMRQSCLLKQHPSTVHYTLPAGSHSSSCDPYLQQLERYLGANFLMPNGGARG